MTLKEEFLSIKTYEEFDKKRDKFRPLKIDKEIKAHLDKLFGYGKKRTDVITESEFMEDK